MVAESEISKMADDVTNKFLLKFNSQEAIRSSFDLGGHGVLEK